MSKIELTDTVKVQVAEKIEDISHTLMNHEKKDGCMEGISQCDWCGFAENDVVYVIVPSPYFKKLIICCGYLKAIGASPELFGTDNPIDVVKAIQKTEKFLFPTLEPIDVYSKSYLSQETMAYIFEIKDNVVSEKVLRLDLYRGIDGNDFLGGLFHAFKHFTIEGYKTISYKKVGFFEMPCMEDIIVALVKNFFSNEFKKENPSSEDCAYVYYSTLREGVRMKGVYYKEEHIPVYFLNTLYVNNE